MKLIVWLCCYFGFVASLSAKETSLPITLDSKYNFSDTIKVLDSTLQSKGMQIFAHIDHQQAAKEQGIAMQPAVVIIYGNPMVGTPLMVADPSLALQLPLKVLVTEAESGKVTVVLNSAKQIIEHTHTPYSAVEDTLAKPEKLIRKTIAK